MYALYLAFLRLIIGDTGGDTVYYFYSLVKLMFLHS